jgi:hypothetical protein
MYQEKKTSCQLLAFLRSGTTGKLQNVNGKEGVYGGNLKIVTICRIYKVPVSNYSVSEGQIAQPQTVIPMFPKLFC